MKKLIVTIALIAIAKFATAQNPCYIKYTYDASGNRIKREFICAPLDSVIGGTTTDPDCCPGSKLAGNNKAPFDFNVYPNPTTGIFNLSIDGSVYDAIITIHNSVGVLLQKFSTNDAFLELTLREYASGVYYISVQTNTMKITKKVQKE